MELPKDTPNNSQLCIGIVGNGFSGIISTYELVLQASSLLNIFVFDSSFFAGSGIAYSTDCHLHLLNVTVEKMSGLQNDPDHLYHWLTHSQLWRTLHPSFSSLHVHKKLFLPRMIYHAYLEHIASLTKEMAKIKRITLHPKMDNVVDIGLNQQGKIELFTSSGQSTSLDRVILATGMLWTRPLANDNDLDSDSGYLEAPWPILTTMANAKEWLSNSKEGTTIAMIGSGLTMLDALSSLYACGYPGRIEIVSHQGKLPQPHDVTLIPLKPFEEAEDFPNSALEIVRKLRHLSLATPDHKGYDWRCIIDALRPITSSLWTKLAQNEKRRVLRHLFFRWNIYRHRAPPEPLELFQAYKSQERLAIIKANATALVRSSNKIVLNLIDAHSGKSFSRTYDKVINCSGPSFCIESSPNPLIQNMLKKGFAAKDSLGLGFHSNGNLLTSEKAPGKLMAVGSLLFGSHFETLAVPELRKQCQQVARKMLHKKLINTDFS